MERVTVHVDERQCNSWRLLNLRGLFILICLSMLCVDFWEIILWGDMCPTQQGLKIACVCLALATVGNVFASPASGATIPSTFGGCGRAPICPVLPCS